MSTEWILSEIPADQRAKTRRRIETATALGWKSIGLWTADEPPNETDLAGVNPVTGQVAFIPLDLDEELIPSKEEL